MSSIHLNGSLKRPKISHMKYDMIGKYVRMGSVVFSPKILN
jgi:hypothetical protein